MASNLVQPLASDEQPTAPQPAMIPETTGGVAAQQPNTAQGAAQAPAPAPMMPAVPKDLIKLPAFQALFSGAPPALSYHIKGFEDREEKEIIKDHKDFLQKAGIKVYKSLSGDRGVIYNALHIHPADLYAADKMGKLDQIAPDFDSVQHALAKSGITNPVLRVTNVPNSPPRPRSATIAPTVASQNALTARITGGGPPNAALPSPKQPSLPASVQRQLIAARSTNVQPGAPTAGPVAGQGRLLSSILKPVV